MDFIDLVDSSSDSDGEDLHHDPLGPAGFFPFPGYPFYSDSDSEDLSDDLSDDGRGFYWDDIDEDSDDDGFGLFPPLHPLPRLMLLFHHQQLLGNQMRQIQQRRLLPVSGQKPEHYVHYSPNSQAKCQKCKKPIAEGELRVSDVLDYGRLGVCPGSKYTHLVCFTPRNAVRSIYHLSGVSQLQEEDKQQVINRLKECNRWSPPGWVPESKEKKRELERSVLAQKKVVELKLMCQEKGLKRTGVKAALIDRLLDYQEGEKPYIPPEQPMPVVEWQFEQGANLFDVLPEEMILKIISYLGPSDFAHLSSTSRRFNDFLQEDMLWKGLYERTWPDSFKEMEECLKKRKRDREDQEQPEREAKKDKEKEGEASEGENNDDTNAPPAKKHKSEHETSSFDEGAEIRIGTGPQLEPFGLFPPLFDFMSAKISSVLKEAEEKKNLEEEEAKVEQQTWKQRFYTQHLNALLEQRFQWPQDVLIFQSDETRELHPRDFHYVINKFDIACLKELCRVYGIDQNVGHIQPRLMLIERLSIAFKEGKITNFSKIADMVNDRKARVKARPSGCFYH